MKNWKHIEYVVLKDSYHGDHDNTVYSTIEEFTHASEFCFIRAHLTEHPTYVGIIDGYLYSEHRRYQLVDECDMVIPLWKIKEYLPYIAHHFYYNNLERAKHAKYRVDPIPNTGKRSWRFSHSYRTPHTKQEITLNDFHAIDDEIVYHGIKIRAKRNKLHVPNSWDDYPRSDLKNRNSWKSNRKTQYKP